VPIIKALLAKNLISKRFLNVNVLAKRDSPDLIADCSNLVPAVGVNLFNKNRSAGITESNLTYSLSALPCANEAETPDSNVDTSPSNVVIPVIIVAI